MKIGDRGQVTIPKHIREKYGLLPQMEVEFVAEKSGVLIKKKTVHISPVDKVFGILNAKSRTDPHIESVRGR